MACYLITGGAGFFGTILKKHFLALGEKCVSIDLEHDDFKDENFTSYQGDINDDKLMDEIFFKHKFDAIFHCAALLAHVKKDLKRLWHANVDGTKNVCNYALKNNINKIVFISSNCLWAKNFDDLVLETETPNPVEIYGKSKLEAEKILLSHKDKINSIIFRSPTIMDEGRLGLLGILFEFIDENRKLPMVGDGKNCYQFIYAKDLANAFELALSADYTDIFNIGSDDVKTFNEVYEYVIKKSGSKTRLLHFPKLPMIWAMKICFWLGISPLGPYQYKMIASSFVFDTQKIKEKLGFKPTLKNEEMLLRAYEFYHKNKQEILNRKDVSAHNSVAKMGVIKILKWFM
ncbi:MAG: NAD(P)-dependent oxidoreductase [Alphaproteobacteria bacterium]|nr:NAD(P)-dependent oxidoreductase [Alphaproteobacteria bacterium]